MPNILEYVKAKFRNFGRAKFGGRPHSVSLKLYDNGKLVLEREIYFYESFGGRADELHVAQRLNAFASERYGLMRRRMKMMNRNGHSV